MTLPPDVTVVSLLFNDDRDLAHRVEYRGANGYTVDAGGFPSLDAATAAVTAAGFAYDGEGYWRREVPKPSPIEAALATAERFGNSNVIVRTADLAALIAEVKALRVGGAA